MGTDNFASHQAGLSSPASQAFDITPADGSDLTIFTRGIMVGVSGDLRVRMVGDSSPITLPNVAAGIVHPLRVARVYSTSTTATGIKGFT